MLISPGRLRDIACRVCRAAGCNDVESGLIAGHLVDANLAGHDSHGVGMLPTYVAAIAAGHMRLGQHVVVLRDSGPIIVVDGGMGAGQVIAHEAMELGIARTRATGAVIIGVRRSHHVGRVGAWAEQCAAAGLASIHFVNVIGHRPYVAPFGGRDGRLATNPFCAGLPATDGPPVILDMATSRIAFGKVVVARNRGAALPDGCILDAAGHRSTDPNDMFADPPGALLPFGEHKGYGLGLVCDLLAGALVGGGTNQPANHRDGSIVNNMLSIIIDPAAVGDAGYFRSEFDSLTAWVKASPPVAAAEGAVLVPGDPERRHRAARQRDGIEIDATTWESIVAAGASVGCDMTAAGAEAAGSA